MATTNFTTSFVVDQTPEQVFNAVTNVRGWWSEEIEGGTAKLNDEFDYHYKDVHKSKNEVNRSGSKQKGSLAGAGQLFQVY